MERWLAQRLSHRLGAGPGAGAGVCANVRFPSARVPARGRRGRRHRDRPGRRPLGSRPRRVAAAGADRRRGGLGRRPVLRAGRAPGARRAGQALRAGPGAGRAVRLVRHAPARVAARVGGGRRRGAAGPGVAARAVAPAARRARRAGPGRAARRRRRRAARRRRRRARLPDAALAVRADPAGRRAPRRAGGAGRAPRTCTCGCRTPRRSCGTRCGPDAAADPPAAGERTTARAGSGTRCCARSAGTSGSWRCACPPPGPASPTPTTRPRFRTGRRRCCGACRTALRDDAPPVPPDDRPLLDDGDRSVVRALLPRPGPAGRGAARGAGRAARRRPTLEPRDIVVMCPDIEVFAPLITASFGLAPDRRPVTRATVAGRAAPRAHAAGAAGRPGAAAGEPAARHGVHAAGARRVPAHRVPGARPGGVRPGPAPLPARRRRSGDAVRAGHRGRGALGAGRGRTAAATGWGRSARTPGRPGWTGSCSASRWPRRRARRRGWARPCRWTRSTRPGWTSSAGSPRSSTGWHPAHRAAGAAAADRVDRRPGRRACPRSPTRLASDAWQAAQARAELADVLRRGRSSGGHRRPRPHRRPGAAGRAAARAAEPGELPHRHAHRRHPRPDAGGAAPRGVPARLRRRRVPPRRRARTGTTCWPAARSSGNATRAARTGSCSWTRSARPPSTWSSCARGRTSAPAPSGRPRCRSASCSTPWTRPCAPAPGSRRRRRCAHGIPCSRSTGATSSAASCSPPVRSASTGTRCAVRWPRAGRGAAVPLFPASPLPEATDGAGTVELEDLIRFVEHPAAAFLRQRVQVRGTGGERGTGRRAAGRAGQPGQVQDRRPAARGPDRRRRGNRRP